MKHFHRVYIINGPTPDYPPILYAVNDYAHVLFYQRERWFVSVMYNSYTKMTKDAVAVLTNIKMKRQV